MLSTFPRDNSFSREKRISKPRVRMFSVYFTQSVKLCLSFWSPGWAVTGFPAPSCEIFPPLAGYSWVNALALNKSPFSVARGWGLSEKLWLISLQQNYTPGLFLCCQSCTLIISSLSPWSLPVLLPLVWGGFVPRDLQFPKDASSAFKNGKLGN